jgi:hypothetical protein
MNKDTAKFFAENANLISSFIKNNDADVAIYYNAHSFNKSNIDFYMKNLDVIDKYANGIPIQSRKNKNHKWKDESSVFSFEFANYEYRVRPEPRKFRIAVDKNNQICGVGIGYFPEGFQMPNMGDISFIEVQEILE